LTRPLAYTNLDFDSLVADLKQRLEDKPAWKGLTDSSTTLMLIEAIAYATINAQYYLQRVFEEIFVDTAQFWESLVRLGNLVGYKVKRARGAVATVRLYKGDTEVTIPADTVMTINGYTFYFPNDVVVPAGDSNDYVEATVRQGVKQVYNFDVTNSYPFLKFNFGSEKISDQDIKVYVGDNLWTQVPYVLLSKDKQVYEIATLPDKTLELRFGTLDTGLPLVGQTISIHCYEVEGEDANYFGDSPSCSNSVLGVPIEVIPPISGGGSMEDLESLRVNVPLAYRLVSGFVAAKDYEKFVSNTPGVFKAKAMDVKDQKLVPFRVVRIYVLPEGGYELSSAFKDELTNYLNDMIPAGLEVEIKSPLIRDVKIGVGAVIKRGYDANSVKSNMISAVQSLYDPNNLEFGQWIPRADIKYALEQVAGVKSINIYYPIEDVTLQPYEFMRLVQLDISVSMG